MQSRKRGTWFWFILGILLALASGSACRSGKQPAMAEPSANNTERARDGGTSAAFAVLEQYCDLESKQEYTMLYELLSDRRKKYLEKFKVHSADDYRKLRESSEASWSGFVIKGHSKQEDGRITFNGRARVEESGQVEEQQFKAVLILERGVWRLDDWAY